MRLTKVISARGCRNDRLHAAGSRATAARARAASRREHRQQPAAPTDNRTYGSVVCRLFSVVCLLFSYAASGAGGVLGSMRSSSGNCLISDTS
jgi:hypothetical protein